MALSSRLWAVLKESSLAAKVGLGVAALVLILTVGGVTRSCVSDYKDRKADEAITEERARGEAHRQRADEWQAKAEKLEGDVKVQELIIKTAGQKVEAIAEKVEDEDKRFQDEQTAIGADIDLCERLKRVCTRLKLKAADCPCQ